MPTLKKLLSRFDKKEQGDIELLIKKILSFKWDALDVKKLKGYSNLFRVRKGNIRIIYRLENRTIFILAIEHRNESTYRF